VFLLSCYAFAQSPTSRVIPETVSTSLKNGTTQTVTAQLWTTLAGGTLVFSEVEPNLKVTSASLTFLLGSKTPSGLNPANFASGTSLYLDVVQTGVSVLSGGRIPMYATPFSLSPGPQGPVGPIGLQGPQGVQGATGAMGLQGPTGATGAMGPQGLTGPVGPTGPAGLGIHWRGPWVCCTTQYNAQDAVSWAGQSYIAVNNINSSNSPDIDITNWTLLAQQGGAGPQGPLGLTGAMGLQGPTGATGAMGPQGLPGVIQSINVGSGITGGGSATQVPIGLDTSFTDQRYPLRSQLSAPGTINSVGNPLDWSQLKGVPASVLSLGLSGVGSSKWKLQGQAIQLNLLPSTIASIPLDASKSYLVLAKATARGQAVGSIAVRCTLQDSANIILDDSTQTVYDADPNGLVFPVAHLGNQASVANSSSVTLKCLDLLGQTIVSLENYQLIAIPLSEFTGFNQ